MTSQQGYQPEPQGAPGPARSPHDDPFLRTLSAALTALGAPGERTREERAPYQAPGAARPPSGLRPLLREARQALEGAGAASANDAASEALGRLDRLARARTPQVAALARRLYPDTAALAEDVFLARCLIRETVSALEMAAMRRYLQDAAVPPAQADLSLDRATCREQVSFPLLWSEPHRFEGMRATFEYFRGRYSAVYRQQHEGHRRALARLVSALADVGGPAEALTRLNTLEGLGRPLGREALAGLAALQGVRPCPRQEPLTDPPSPVCACGFVLGDEAPAERVDEAIRRLQRALAKQMARLSTQAVRRILSRRRGERLERFLQVVQASDVSGLVNVLDGELLAFLRQVLSPEVPPPKAEAPPAEVPAPVLERLVRSFPVIGAGQVDQATAEFQRLLLEALEEAGRVSPRRAPLVRLAPSPARRRPGAGGPQ